MKHHFMPLCDTSEFLREKFAGYSTVKFKVWGTNKACQHMQA